MNKIKCTVCGNTKGPLFKVEVEDQSKRYICKNCISILKARQRKKYSPYSDTE